MDLYIIRHAWAEDRDYDRWPDDSLRPLSSDGVKRFCAMVGKLKGSDFAPSILATSPYRRCRQTADLLAGTLDKTPEIVELDALTPGSQLQAMIVWTVRRAAEGHERIGWVGHAPDVDRMTSELTGGESMIRFAKGAIAMIRFADQIPDDPSQLSPGELHWLLTAKMLGV